MKLGENPQAKITPLKLQMAAATHLDGTNLGELVTRAQLTTDEEGNIQPHVIRSLRTMLKVAAEKTPSDIVRRKCQTMRDFLEEYDEAN